MRETSADKIEIVHVELNPFVGRQGFVVQDIEVAHDAAGCRVAAASCETDPACQPHGRQGAGDCLMGCPTGTGERCEIRCEFIVTGKSRYAVVVEQETKNLPGVSLQGRQAAIEEERPGHGIMTVAGEDQAIRTGGGLPGRCVRAFSLETACGMIEDGLQPFGTAWWPWAVHG
ncbi:hypothetical protein KOE73_12100 [Acidomonas methanolica]|uniref:Uncharacterized protein n=1 Tax=Acidomonas methanolica NBRC 104435 TaxID=1231351 RepID=A0A023D5K8_ACIMT|nr:hypothetical protein [Acidomonas methanolica]GAJ29354.1 hypothetical protein Amme_059_073 [Acidomonas methanolica NBRC 104435]